MAESQQHITQISRPLPEHEWLRQLVGAWSFDTPRSDDADELHEGAEIIAPIGDLWIQATATGDVPEGSHTSVTTLGYDPEQGRFVGTWIGSMMNFLWVYSGYLDEAGTTLTLEASGPDFEKALEHRNYRDVMRILSPNDRTLTGMVQEPDGEWRELMTVHYRRR